MGEGVGRGNASDAVTRSRADDRTAPSPIGEYSNLLLTLFYACNVRHSRRVSKLDIKFFKILICANLTRRECRRFPLTPARTRNAG